MDYIAYIIDFILHLDIHLEQLIEAYGTWIYVILFLVIFCETGLVVTPFLPGDTLLFVAGTLSSINSNHLNVHLLAISLIGAAVLGDSTNYIIGKFFGERLFRNPNSKLFKQSNLEKTRTFYQKHGGKTIVLARFFPIIRTFAPFVAGMGSMSYKRFSSFNVIGGVAWVSLFSYLGYFFGGLSIVKNNLWVLVIAINFISLIPAAVEYLRSRKVAKTDLQ
ncbi:MAG: DedA family protein [Dysgonamonadaceae bacterium]|jgi:membrane-associated protein|nr:DedA family protein [Dysgonamonadaceae bacterium]